MTSDEAERPAASSIQEYLAASSKQEYLASQFPAPGKATPDVIRELTKIGKLELWTVNEVVAYNLRQARLARGWSQERLAEALSAQSGRQWSNATVSAAERSRESGRTRRFDSGDLVAFALVFEVPIGYFFVPPEPEGAAQISVSFLTMEELCEHIDREIERHKAQGGHAAAAAKAVIGTTRLVAAIDPDSPGRDVVTRMRRLLQPKERPAVEVLQAHLDTMEAALHQARERQHAAEESLKMAHQYMNKARTDADEYERKVAETRELVERAMRGEVTFTVKPRPTD